MALDVDRSYGYTISVTIRKEIFGANAAVTVSDISAYMQSILSTTTTQVKDLINANGFSVNVDGQVSVGASTRTGKEDATMYLLVQGMGFGAIRARDSLQASILTKIATIGGSWAGGTALDPLGIFTRGDATANGDQSASGKGDPHLTNMNGQRFDLYQEGVHVLLLIPRRAKPQDTLLRVEANAQRLGAACADLYFQVINITGNWSEPRDGLQFYAQTGTDVMDWKTFGTVDLKVVRGTTVDGIKYLNVFVKHLNAVKFPVGGLLGEDDHVAAATPGPECSTGLDLHAQGASFAVIEG